MASLPTWTDLTGKQSRSKRPHLPRKSAVNVIARYGHATDASVANVLHAERRHQRRRGTKTTPVAAPATVVQLQDETPRRSYFAARPRQSPAPVAAEQRPGARTGGATVATPG